MTKRNSARVAGIAYLLYIAFAYPAMVIDARATRGADVPARLATLTQHVGDMRLVIVLEMLGCFCALVLAVTLWALTREVDPQWAGIGAMFRVAEGVTGLAGLPFSIALLGIMPVSASGPDLAATQAVAALMFKRGALIGATCFAVGSTIFCALLLRGRVIPAWLAWLGVIGSAIIAVALPIQILQGQSASFSQLIWLPIAIFEITVALYFIFKGVRTQD